MINSSVEISDDHGMIRAAAFRKMDLHEPLVEISIEQYAQTFRGVVFDEAEQVSYLLERSEAISFGHALIALGESL